MSDPRTQPGPTDRDDPSDDDDQEIGPLEGLLDPDEGANSPAGEADAPAPPG